MTSTWTVLANTSPTRHAWPNRRLRSTILAPGTTEAAALTASALSTALGTVPGGEQDAGGDAQKARKGLVSASVMRCRHDTRWPARSHGGRAEQICESTEYSQGFNMPDRSAQVDLRSPSRIPAALHREPVRTQ